MLAVPTIPWCRAKCLERRAMRDVLPLAVLHRPKSPLKGDPHWEAARHRDVRCRYPVQTLAQYVNFDRLPTEAGSKIALFQVNFRPLALNYWLRNLRQRPLELNTKEELDNEFVTKST